MIDPRMIKTYLPGAVGLTSRLIDKDTKDLTLTGNMDLDAGQKNLLNILRKGEALVRAEKAEKVGKPTR
jgi:ethanolamine utilization microcompartment shell protein EutS